MKSKEIKIIYLNKNNYQKVHTLFFGGKKWHYLGPRENQKPLGFFIIPFRWTGLSGNGRNWRRLNYFQILFFISQKNPKK